MPERSKMHFLWLILGLGLAGTLIGSHPVEITYQSASPTPTPQPTVTATAFPTATITQPPTATIPPSATPTATTSPTMTASATSTTAPTFTSTPTATIPPLSSLPLDSELQKAERLLFVDQAKQMMYVYENSEPVRTIPISTGKPTSTTLTVSWTGIVGRDQGGGGVDYGFLADYRWHLYKGLYGNILIHSVPYTSEGDIKYYDKLTSVGVEPTSHGCVRISPTDAAWLKEWNPVGATIKITRLPEALEQPIN